jgi:FkbM family methyltransferase
LSRFISYAQNFEDVMLWRALAHIEGGFYIDLGSWSPDLDSTTKAFYLAGWSGINVEPNPDMHAELQKYRARDINLMVAIAASEGSADMFFFDSSGLSTLSVDIAREHENSGLETTPRVVQTMSLGAIWNKHVRPSQAVHFLKIDIEGGEEGAIKGLDWSLSRPWIVVVEATLPGTQIPSYSDWEPILLASDYSFVYDDGLNRFYLANEHAELSDAFIQPPNVFDNFVMAGHAQAEAGQAQAEAGQAQAEAGQAQAEAGQAQAEAKLAKWEGSWLGSLARRRRRALRKWRSLVGALSRPGNGNASA